MARFISRKGFDLVEAEHRGYLRLSDPLVHRRLVMLNKNTGRVVIEDQLEGRGNHLLEWFFHLAPGCEASLDPTDLALHCRIGTVVFAIHPEVLPDGAQAFLKDGRYSRGYGRVEPAPVVRYVWEGPMPITSRFDVVVERTVEAHGE